MSFGSNSSSPFGSTPPQSNWGSSTSQFGSNSQFGSTSPPQFNNNATSTPAFGNNNASSSNTPAFGNNFGSNSNPSFPNSFGNSQLTITGNSTFSNDSSQKINFRELLNDEISNVVDGAFTKGAQAIFDWLNQKEPNCKITLEELEHCLSSISVNKEDVTSTAGKKGAAKKWTEDEIKIFIAWLKPGFEDKWRLEGCQYITKAGKDIGTTFKYCDALGGSPFCQKHAKPDNAACKKFMEEYNRCCSVDDRKKMLVTKHTEAVEARIKKGASSIGVTVPDIKDVLMPVPKCGAFNGNIGSIQRVPTDKLVWISETELKHFVCYRRTTEEPYVIIGKAEAPGTELIAIPSNESEWANQMYKRMVDRIKEYHTKIDQQVNQMNASKNAASNSSSYGPSSALASFGSNFGGHSFGQQVNTESSPFGQQGSPFGQQGSPFGQQPQQSQSTFGQQPQQSQSTFGQQPQQQGSPFGQQQLQQQGSPFVQQQEVQQQPPQQGSPFGQQPTFPAQQQPTFGQQQSQQQGSPFGQQQLQQQGSPFGQQQEVQQQPPQQGSPFGQQQEVQQPTFPAQEEQQSSFQSPQVAANQGQVMQQEVVNTQSETPSFSLAGGLPSETADTFKMVQNAIEASNNSPAFGQPLGQ